MNLRVDLILPTEQRSGSLITRRFAGRVAMILGPSLLAIVLIFQIVASAGLARELADKTARYAAIGPQQEGAKLLSAEYQTHLAILAELKAWQNSRIAWHTQLEGLMACIPANMQLQNLSLRQTLQMTPESKPARLYTMELAGKATGTAAEQNLKTLQAQLLGAPAFTSLTSTVTIPLFAQDTTPGSAHDARVFQILCQYAERVLK